MRFYQRPIAKTLMVMLGISIYAFITKKSFIIDQKWDFGILEAAAAVIIYLQFQIIYYLKRRQKMEGKKFIFKDEISGRKYILPLGGDMAEGLQYGGPWNYVIIPDELWDKIVSDIEARGLETKFGIHDVSCNGKDEILGFTSYEVEEKQFPELMSIWKEMLISYGFEVGELKIDI